MPYRFLFWSLFLCGLANGVMACLPPFNVLNVLSIGMAVLCL